MRRRTLAAVAVFAVTAVIVTGLPMPPPAAGAVGDCNKSWDGGGDGQSWHDAANWDKDTVPAAGAVVCIPTGASVVYTAGDLSIGGAEVDGKLFIGDGSLSVDGEAIISDLTIAGGTLTGTGLLTVAGGFTWKGGEIAGSGTLDLQSTVAGSITQTSAKTLGRHLRNSGSLTWSGGDILMATDSGRDANLENLGTFTIDGATSAYLASGTDVPWIINGPDATIEKTGAGAATLGNQSLNIVNDGTVSVAGGTLWLDGVLSSYPDASPASSAWTVAAGATLKLSGADIVTNSDDISLLGPGATIVDDNDADALRNLANNTGTLRLGGGRDLEVPGDFTNGGTLALGPGSVFRVPDAFHAGSGTILVDIAGTAQADFGVVAVSGTANLGGTLSANVASAFTPAPTDEFTVVDADALSGTFATVTGDLHIRYDTVAGNVVLAAAGVGPPTSCNVAWDGDAGDGRWDSAANWSTDALPGATDWACTPEGVAVEHSSGTSAVAALSVEGTLMVSGGTLTIAGDSSIADLDMTGGTFTGAGAVVVQDGFAWSGGTLTGTGDLRLVSSVTASITDDVTLGRRLVNEGSLTWQGGEIVEAAGGGGHLDNHATFDIRTSETAAPQVTNQAGATITKSVAGTSTLAGNGAALVNDGILDIGIQSELVAGGPFTQGAGGELHISIGGTTPGTEHGRLTVTGSAALDGVLSTVTLEGYEMRPGDEYVVLDAATLAGTFAEVQTWIGFTARYDEANGTVTLATEASAACTVTWDGGGGSTAWGTAANWDTDSVPGPSDHACIPEGSTVVHSSGTSAVGAVSGAGHLTITSGSLSIAGESTFAELTVANGVLSGDGDFSVQDEFGWSGGVISGAGTLTVAAAATASLSGGTKYLERHLVNEGSLTWSDGNIILHGLAGGLGHLDNAGTFAITGDDGAQWFDGGSAPRITNRPGATITKTGTAIATLGSSGVVFTNDGTITSTEGTLRVGGGGAGTGGSGSWTLPGGGITFTAGTWELAGNVSGLGTLGVSGGTVRMSGSAHYGAANTAISGGSLDLDNTPATPNTTNTLTVSGGVLSGDGDVSVGGQFNWTNGNLSGAGTLTVTAGATGSISTGNSKYLERHLVNEASLTWSDGNIILHGLAGGLGHLDNAGTFAITGDDGAQWYDGGSAPRITNRPGATITKTGTAIATLGSSGVVFTNDGTITSTEGTLRVGGGGAGTGGSGSWTLPGGGITFTAGTWELAGNVSGLGTLGVSGGTVRMSGSAHYGAANTAVSGGSLDLDNTPATPNTTNTLTVSGGVLSGDGDVSVGGQFNWTNGNLSGAGTLTVAAGVTGSISTGNSKYLERHLVNEGSLTWSDGNIILHGLAGGLGHLDNAGTFAITGDDGAQWFDGGSAPRITNRPGATITKTGTAIATLGSSGVVFTNDGTIAVGSASRLNVGAPFTQGGTGRLEVTIAGTSPGTTHGRLDISGTATLAGTLAAILADGYTPGADDEFVVVDATTLSGTFAAVEGPLTPRYDPPNGTVTLFTDEAPPVPPTVTILPQSAAESAGVFLVEVRGVGGNAPTTVPFQVLAGTAQATQDYSTLFTPAGVTVNPDASTFVPVTIIDDGVDEDDEAFTVSAGGASAPVTIVDDDAAPVAVIDGLGITESDGENVDAPLAVRLVDPLFGLLPQESAKVVTVAAATHDGTALAGSDYVETIGNVAFAPGETTKYFAVPVIGDTEDEDDEQFSATITAAGNVTVAAGESATVTIVDDDATGGPGTVSEELATGGAALFDLLDDWASEYDLDRSGPSPFELPALTDELAGLYEPQDDLEDLDSPFDGLDDDLEALCDQLQLRGLTIDWVEGGVCGHPAPPTAADIIQVRYTARLSDLAEAVGFSGDEFNDDTAGVLDGLVSSLGLDADFESSADVVVTLVLGVDETGFYVANESGLRLEADATATVDGAGTVAGVDGLDVGGPATVDVAVLLTANGGPARLRAADLAAPPSSYLRPAAEGTVGLALDATLEPLSLRWDSTFTLTVDAQFQTDIDLQASLAADMTLPGLDDGGTAGVFDMVGTYDNGVWTLTGAGVAGGDYTWAGFDVADLAFEATLAPDRFDGSATANLQADLGAAGGAVAVGLTAAFDHSAVHATGHVVVDELSLPVAYLGGVTLDATIDGDIAAGTATGSVAVAAADVVLLPLAAPPGTVPAGVGSAAGASGTLDSAGNLALHADSLSGSIADAIDFTITGVDLKVGPGATGPIFTAPSATGTLRALNGLGVTFTGLRLERDGTFGADGVEVSSQGLLQTIGLGGILPFDITTVDLSFPDWANLNTFEVRVTGSIDFAALAGLPFTPIIGIGGEPVTPSSPAEENRFTFSIAVESLSEGKVRPLNISPITLGFDDLIVGDVTLGAQLTLGGYQGGVWVNDVCGSLSVLAGFDDIAGEAEIDVCGSLDAGRLDLAGTFTLSAKLSDDVSFTGASLDFGLGIAVDDAWNFTITGPTFGGAGIDRVEVGFGEYMRFVGTEVDINFAPAPGDPLISIGGQPCPPGQAPPCDGSASVEFDEGIEVLSDWRGEVGNFAIGTDLVPMLLPGFFLNIRVPDDERFGLPDWLPLRIDEVGITFPNVDLGNIPPGGIPLTDLTGFKIRFSGGLEATEQWPISAAVDGLEVDLGRLVAGEFPITNLSGFKMGVEPFELVPGFEVGGGLELGTIEVDGDPAPGEQLEDVFYGRIFGQFEFEGFGAGIDLVVSQYGPVLAQVQVPLAIPLDGGLLGGILLSSVQGGITFGGPAFPDPQRPLEILHDPAFETDFPVNDDTIRASVEPAVQTEGYTWDNGFTIALSGTMTHAMAPAIVTGDVTIGMNVGIIPNEDPDQPPLPDPTPGVKFIGTGDIETWGMPFAGAALLMDLTKPLDPKFDFAFETPQPANPLSFLMPARAQLEASLDTKGILPGFGLGVATFVQRAASGTLEVGQDFFDATLQALATSLEGEHRRPLARLLLDTNGDGLVSGGEDGQVITREFLTSRVLTMMGGGGLPADPNAAGTAARMFAADLLSAAGEFTDDFDLSAVFNHADYAAFAQLLGSGYEAVAAFSGVVKAATLQAGQAFWDQFDPSFHLKGMLQPIILGIPFGEPQHEVEVIITKDGLGFGFDTSIMDLSKQLCAQIIPYIGGAACTLLTLGLEEHLGMTFELPIGGVIEGLFGGSGLPTIDPMSGDWAIELRGGLRWLDFEVAQMTGLVIAADNPAFVDAHVQKLWEDPDAPLNPSLIPIQTEQHYRDIVEYGGILLTGRLLLPELLTDPVGLLGSLNLQVPEDLLEIPDWVSSIAEHLGRTAQPASIQLFLPGFGDVFQYAFDAPERITPIGSGRALARRFNRIVDAAYIEGTFDGTLLSLPFAKALVTGTATRLQVRGELPLIGLDVTTDLDMGPALGTNGPVELPRAMMATTIDEADVDDVLARFGLPPIIGAVAGVDATFRAVSPGYDTSSNDRLLQAGGIEIASRLRIAGIVNNAGHTISISPNGDVAASAQVGSFTPVPGIRLTNGSVGFTQRAGVFAGTLGGTVQLDDWLAAVLGVATVAVQGTFDMAGNVSLSISINGVTYDLVALMNASIDQIVDFLVSLGYGFVAIAEILYNSVTRAATTIVDQLVRIGAQALDIAEALYGSVTQNIRVLVQQLVRVANQIEADFAVIAAALDAAATAFSDAEILNAIDDFTNAALWELVDALEAMGRTTLSQLINMLEGIGYSDFAAIAAALDAAATAFTDGEILNAIDDFTNAALWQLVDALEAMGRTALSSIINMLEAIGYTDVADLAEALDAAATAFTDGEILDALDDFTGATLGQLVDALQAMGRTAFGTIIDMLEAIGYTDIRALAEALDDATSASYREIAAALDDFTSASFNTIGDALRFAGAGWNTVADALDWATTATVSEIADAVRYAGASYTWVMRALENELRVTRYETAAELQRLQASVPEILTALVAVYDAGVNSLVNVLVYLGTAYEDAVAAVTDFLDG